MMTGARFEETLISLISVSLFVSFLDMLDVQKQDSCFAVPLRIMALGEQQALLPLLLAMRAWHITRSKLITEGY